jgi:hypothetical protein
MTQRRSPHETLAAIERAGHADEAERILSLADQELEAELQRAGIDLEEERGAAEGARRAALRAFGSDVDLDAVDPGGSRVGASARGAAGRPPKRGLRRSRRFWVVVALAAGVGLGLGLPHLLLRAGDGQVPSVRDSARRSAP